ncbi:MAG: hypothetical protein Q9194_007281 [Teloschistes cf. exilis]
MQEAFVASLLAIAAGDDDDDDGKVDVRNGDGDGDGGLERFVLWREMKKQLTLSPANM